MAFCSDILFWHSFWYSIWHLLWHFFWHLSWQSIWHSILCGILSGIYSGIHPCILSGILFSRSQWALLEVQQCPRRSGICCWEEGDERRKEEVSLKSRDPHLAGGKSHSKTFQLDHLLQWLVQEPWFSLDFTSNQRIHSKTDHMFEPLLGNVVSALD